MREGVRASSTTLAQFGRGAALDAPVLRRFAQRTARACARPHDPEGPTTARHLHVSYSRPIELITPAKVAPKTARNIDTYTSGASRKPSSCRMRVGWRILRNAFAS